MSTTLAIERTTAISPRFKGRVAGVFEALEGVTSAYGQVVVLGRLVGRGENAGVAPKPRGFRFSSTEVET
jgi:hypothetical protein